MDFNKRMLPTNRNNIFQEEGFYVWCGSAFSYGGYCYLLYSRWPKSLGFAAWVTDSEICLARANNIFGDFKYRKVILGKDKAARWDASCKHNPTVLQHGGLFYLYYMGNNGGGDWWTHRNNQRIGCAYTDDPEGEWTRLDNPVIDVEEHGFDSLLTSNPTVTNMPDGRILAIYKGVSRDGEMPKGGAVVCGVAVADSPLGPFVKENMPIMQNPEDPWSVEDPFVWFEAGRYYALVKDFHGYFTKTGEYSIALFESADGFDWIPSDTPLAFSNELRFDDGSIKKVALLERPQLYFESGKPAALLCACAEEENCRHTYNIRIPLKR